MTGIYLIRNNINGKCYVGQSMDVEKRWKRHKRDSKKKGKQVIHFAIEKYGIENFSFSIIEECSAEQLNEREIYWIDFYKSFGKYGYNCTIGGDGNNQGKDCYSAEYHRAAKKAYYEANKDKCKASNKARYDANKDDPEFKKKECARNKARYEAHKDDPEFKKKECARNKARYEAHKDDPEFKEKNNAASKAFYDAHKDDPEFKKKKIAASKAWKEANRDKVKASNKAYKDAHKLKQTPDHTEMPLW